jgi:hypothetical protein
MKTFGPLYVGTLQYYHRDILPVVEKGWTQETELPFRTGTCMVLRFPKTHPGFYFGIWHKNSGLEEYDELSADERLAKALKIRDMNLTVDEIEEWDV